jgi:hypothetical protein
MENQEKSDKKVGHRQWSEIVQLCQAAAFSLAASCAANRYGLSKMRNMQKNLSPQSKAKRADRGGRVRMKREADVTCEVGE